MTLKTTLIVRKARVQMFGYIYIYNYIYIYIYIYLYIYTDLKLEDWQLSKKKLRR